MSTFFFLGPIRTNESKRTFNVQKLPQMIFWVHLDANKYFSLQKSTNLYRTPMKFFLETKIRFFEKMTPGYPI